MNNSAKRGAGVSLLLLILCFLAAPVSAQDIRKQMQAGNRLLDEGNYRDAVPLYEQVLAADPDNARALYYAGISYMTFDKEKACDYLYRVQELKPNIDKDLVYWLGRADHLNYRFDSAIRQFEKYRKTLKKRDQERRMEVAQLIQQAQNAKNEIANPRNVLVANLGRTINTAYSEHSPVISADFNYLLFTSRGKNVTGGKEAPDGEFYEDIFEARRTGQDEWSVPHMVGGQLNSTGHDASIQLFDKDTKMLLYRAENNGDIMIAERLPDGTWSAPESIGSNINSEDVESDAFITPDGQTLFFSTNHYAGNGDLDIYVAHRKANGDGWQTPERLDYTINTPYDEDSPSLAADGTLYFASRGHNTMGGYDIFSAKYDAVSGNWTHPVNLGALINTPGDDTHYRLAPDGSYAYLSSDRMGCFGGKDIYKVSYTQSAAAKEQEFSQAESSALPDADDVPGRRAK
ncbi:PD40 domain-containing protein [Pontibacter sp. 172403-2]|uniref:tetratricopeptide repeat protein n=1 Tax=Pontibacter rufus TaxID=2791028 RepID=UPI0018AF7F5B|nr:tetratricopeptide repeat protein [Pontibacter sp. 172403-2]MBF9252361.1 PD40 domain-containing protein [Pontibacter sp. 172403-2]